MSGTHISLPVNLTPDVIGYAHHAIPLSVASINERYRSWLLSNFIQIKCYRNFNDGDDYIDLDFTYHYYDNNPWLITNVIPEQDQIGGGFIKDWLINRLIEQTYICLFVDYFYIPSFHHYGKQHFTHELLVFEYDRANDLFGVLGYEEGFGIIRINGSDLVSGFSHQGQGRVYQRQFPIYTYRYNEDYAYSFDLSNVIQLTRDYVDSVDTPTRLGQQDRLHFFDHVHGLSVYTQLGKFYRDPSRQNDLRPLHLLMEHKKIMVARLQFLQVRDNRISAYTERYIKLFHETESMRNRVIKSTLSNDRMGIDSLQGIFERMQEEEYHLLTNLLTILE
jgi:hypothetical protein